MSKGIDIPIDALIADFTAELWTLNTCQFYGRVYRNEFNGVIQPLYYLGTEAVEVLKDDRKDAQCFVDVMPVRKMTADIIEAECRICFMVNLDELYPAVGRSEAIESAMGEVKNLLMSSQFEFIQMVSGPDAFADYKWSEDQISDLQHYHLFRFDLKINYINC